MTSPADSAYRYCEKLVYDTDRDRYLATLFAPKPQRRHLLALYAFDIEIARIRHVVHEPMPGEIRLQWWRDAISRQRDEEAAANPVAAALLDTIDNHRLPLQPFLDLIEARSFDLYTDPMVSVAALDGYADKTDGGIVGLAALVATGASPEPAIRRAIFARTIVRLLQSLPHDASRGQLYLPLDLMQQFGAEPGDLLAGKATPEVEAVLANLRLRARDALTAARAAAVAPAMLPVLLSLAPVKPLLQRMEREHHPFAPPESPRWMRQWSIWRASRDPSRLF
ncbi:MAG TPA: squalene/phytoene synthase family protein [Pseudolabrys sp.]|nr:squalene/phytoene synthase family protein [Pseudolabrys sp.]